MKKTTLKNFYIIIFIIIILLGGVFLLNKKSNNNKTSIIRDAYVKNLTWETDISKQVPFVKGNLLEYVYIISPEQASKIIINLANLNNYLNIKNIEINGEQENINKTKLEIEINNITTLKITGEAIENSNTQDNLNIENNIDIEVEQPLELNSNTENNDNNISEKEDGKEDLKLAENISLNKYDFSSNIDNLVEITGNNLNSISYINIGGNSYTPLIDDDNLYFNIDAKSFDTGEYFVILQLKNGKLITLDKKVSFKLINSDINISGITPNEIKNDKSTIIVLQGNGFNKIISIQLSNNTIIQNTSFNAISDNVMSVKIPTGITPGEYHFNIMDTSGITEIKDINFNITK